MIIKLLKIIDFFCFINLVNQLLEALYGVDDHDQDLHFQRNAHVCLQWPGAMSEIKHQT